MVFRCLGFLKILNFMEIFIAIDQYLKILRIKQKKSENNDSQPVLLINSEKNSGLYVYSGLYANKFLTQFPSCMLICNSLLFGTLE